MRARILLLAALLLTVGIVAPSASADCTNDSEDLHACYEDPACGPGPVCAYRTYCVTVAGAENCTYL